MSPAKTGCEIAATSKIAKAKYLKIAAVPEKSIPQSEAGRLPKPFNCNIWKDTVPSGARSGPPTDLPPP